MTANKIITALAILSLSLNSGLTFSAEKLAGKTNDKCRTNRSDVYDPSVLLLSGPNKGKCLDTSKLRSIIVLNKGQKTGKVTVANFFHKNKFWIATLKPRNVEKMIFQIENFKAIVPAAHTQIRIVMNEGSEIQLTSQTPNADGSHDKDSVRQIVFSVEAIMPPGLEYGLIEGARNHFGLAYRFVSMDQRFNDMIKKDHHKVRQYVLNLSEEEKTNVMNNMLKISDENQYQRFYHTTARSCTTEAFEVLDKAKNYSFIRKVQKRTGSLLFADIYPPEAAWGLSLRGLTNKDLRIADLADDYTLINELESSKD